MDLGVERQHHGRHVGRRIGVRDAAAQGAAVAHLRVADLAAASASGRALRAQDGDVATS